MAGEAVECRYCGADDWCDCQDRLVCPRAGELGHRMCGTHPCGCPRFLGPCTCIAEEFRACGTHPCGCSKYLGCDCTAEEIDEDGNYSDPSPW